MVIKRGRFVVATALVLCLIPGISSAGVRITFKLNGGSGYLGLGDVNAGTQAFFDWAQATLANEDTTITGGYEALHHWGSEFGGDLIFELSPKIGVGIGTGHLRRFKSGLPMMTIDYDSYVWYALYSETKVSATPLRLGLFLTLPVGRKTNLIANAGISWYLDVKYDSTWALFQPTAWYEVPQNEVTTTAANRKNPLGFQGGLGLEHRFFWKVALFIEAQGRYAKIRHLEGTTVSIPYLETFFPYFTETGILYYESVPAIPDAPRLIMVQSSPPDGPGGEPRQAAVDLSGVSLQFGIRIRL